MHTKSSQRDLYQPSQKYWNIHSLKYSAHKSITRQAMYVKRNNDARNHWCRGKAIIITYSECVTVALVIQHKWRRRRIILSPLACPALVYFSTLFRKRPDFGKEKKNLIEHHTCFDFPYNLCPQQFGQTLSYEWNRLHVKYPSFLSYFNETWIFLTDIQKTPKYKIS